MRDHIKAGDLLPLSRGTGGRVLLAFGAEKADPLIKGKTRLLARIREQGYFAATGDRLADVSGISAPVFRADMTLAAAVTLTTPIHRYDARYTEAVLDTARELSGPT